MVRMAAIKKSTNNKYWRVYGEKGTIEDETARWHHRLNGCEFE